MAVAEDKLNTLAIVTIGLASVLLLWASIVALQAYYANTFNAEQARVDAEGRGAELRTLRAEQQASLKALRRNDDGETVRIPVERAQKLVVSELRTGAPESLVPAAGPHDTPTVPPVWGRPPDDARPPGSEDAAEDGEATEAEAEGDGEAETETGEPGDSAEAAGEADESSRSPGRRGIDQPQDDAPRGDRARGQEVDDAEAEQAQEERGD